MELKADYFSQSEAHPSKSIISLALSDFMKEKGLEGSDKVDTEFRDIAAAQLRLFLFAGHDTTSSTLIYCYHLLATHPESMVRICAEHNEVFGTDREGTYQTLLQKSQLLNQLPYTLAVIKEALRLFPPASGFRAGRSYINIVDDNGKIYPTEGCSVWAMHLIIQRNPKYWKDPNSFIPERWLVGPDHPLYPVKGAWRPFEFGPRNCLGQTLAVMELKVVLAMTIRDFEIQPAYDQWDEKLNATHIRTVLGNRAYQVEGGGGGAHPADRYPCKVSIRD
jgi:cytochrome P450